jgi:hypothetical protein
LFPHLAGVVVDQAEAGPDLIRITVRTCSGRSAACPGCGQSSGWEHSRQVRHVADEAVGGGPVMIDVPVRRLYRENADCPKITCVEQVDAPTVRHQRRTPALQRVRKQVAMAQRAGRGPATGPPAPVVVLGEYLNRQRSP